MTDINLPCAVEDVTAEWLGGALRERYPDVSVKSIEVISVIWGTATKVLVDVKYDAMPSSQGPGTKLCIKAGFVPELRAIMGPGYQREALFYRDVAPRIPTQVPRCHYAAVSETPNQGLVILDDLGSQQARFGDPRVALSVDQVAKALEVQAGWHSVIGLKDAWLNDTPHIRNMILGVLQPEHWKKQMALTGSPAARVVLADRDRAQRAFVAKWALDDASEHCFTHGDAHMANLYFDASGQPLFLDWQMAAMAHWANDVNIFLVGALSVEDRRAHERDLLQHYLAARRGVGAPEVTMEEAWLCYRQRHLAGVTFALTPPEMQPQDVCDAFAERFAQAAIDHGTLELLGV